MAYIPEQLRQHVVERAHGLCEYCQTSQDVVIEMEVDHIVPRSAGGTTSEANLCLACISCNRTKGSAQDVIDPETGSKVSLFDPRTQTWADHFQWNEEKTTLIGLTAVGRATIARFGMNREVIVKARQRWVKAGWHPPKPS